MMLPKESLDFLARQAVLAARQDTMFVPGDRKGVYFERQPDGSLMRRIIEPMLQCEADDFAAIMEWLRVSPSPQIWYNRELVEGIRDGYSGLDYIRMPLVKTPQLRKLEKLDGAKYDQASFLRLLKVELYPTVPQDFISQLKKTIFAHQVNQEQTVNQGKQSLDKKILTELRGQNELPEQVTLQVQLFEQLGIRASTLCAVEIDLNECRFSLTPLPLELEKALQYGEEVMRQMLLKAATSAGLADLKVFYGSFYQSLAGC